MTHAEEVKADIIKNFGFFPPFYVPAMELPDLLDCLWGQTLEFFLKNPIPLLFKEKLAALLGRYCSTPYCLVVHISSLMPLGMTASDVRDLIEMPALSYQEIMEKTRCDDVAFSGSWPAPGTLLEECILYSCIGIFLNQESDRLYEKLRQILEPKQYEDLVKLLVYNRTCLDWAESHPEISYKQDERYQKNFSALTASQPSIGDYIDTCQAKFKNQSDRRIFWLTQENKRLLDKEYKLRRESERARQNLNDFFMQAPIPMCLMEGPEHIITLANPPYLKAVDRDYRMLGHTVREIYSDEEAYHFFPLMDEVYQTGKNYSGKGIPFTVLDINGVGRRIFVDAEYRPFLSSHGHIKGVLGFFQDVTDQLYTQHQLEASERHFKSLANSIPHLVFVVNEVGKFNYVNQKVTEYLGLSENEITSETWLHSIHSEDQEQAWEEFSMGIKNKCEWQAEYRFRRKDGTYRWHLARAIPVKEKNGEVNFFGTVTDMESQKRLTEDLEQAREMAVNANETKSSFLANMSHEIRTPLGAILGFTEILKDSDLEISERNNYLDIISRNGNALTSIIDDILDLSKVEAGQLKIENIPFSPRCLIQEVTDLFLENVKTKGIYLNTFLESKIPEQVVSDPARIRQILNNILGNAIKFTQQGGVNLRASVILNLAGQYDFKILITDTGPGLTDAQKKKLFQPFVQADNSTTRKFGGTGLGLVLARRMARALGGDVKIVSSDIGNGSTFMVEFTAEAVPKNMEIKENTSPHRLYSGTDTLSGLRVLVVEDSKDNQILIDRVLSKRGALIEFASDGEEGVSKALASLYDVVLMDIQMPKLDGYGATKKLRSLGYSQPIIALTAHAMEEERRKTKEAGCDGHITKPLSVSLLVATLSQFVPEVLH